MTNNNLLPGILNDDLEFFTVENGVKAITNGNVLNFSELSNEHITLIKAEIEKQPEVKKHLKKMHPNSESKRLEQYVSCRFGGLDYTADLSDKGFQSGEWWDCPFRGNCASEGVLCKSVAFNGNELNNQDIQLLRLLSTNKINEVIAEELNLPLGSFHLSKKNLYAKLGNIQTKQESTIIAQRLNLI